MYSIAYRRIYHSKACPPTPNLMNAIVQDILRLLQHPNKNATVMQILSYILRLYIVFYRSYCQLISSFQNSFSSTDTYTT